MATTPRSTGTRPASTRSNVDFPAPFGPSTATVSPSAASRATSRSSAPRWTPKSAASVTQASEPVVAQRYEHDDRHREQHEAERDRQRLIGFEQVVDRERSGLRPPLDVAGEGDRRAELTECACPRQRGS